MNRSFGFLIVLAVVIGCEKKPAPTSVPDQAPVNATNSATNAAPPSAADLTDATEAGKTITRLNAEMVHHRKQAPKNGWLHLESLASAHLARARLTGDVDDYVGARAVLAEAFAAAPEGSGPFFTRAHYNYTIHRIGDVEADLVQSEKRALRKVEDEEKVMGLRGDLAFHHGDLGKARELYTQEIALKRTCAGVARLAFLDMKTGNLDAARKGYEECVERARSDKAERGWALLQRGIVELEAGDAKAALEWYEKGNQAFSGWYLIEEHIAEAKFLLGDVDGAIAMYESIIARTPNGEFMGALAQCWAAKGDKAKESEWLEKAKVAFERDIAKLPSAASGHALEFYLEHDCKRALELAEQNVKLRPNHEARMQLAQANMCNGNGDAARKALEPVVGSAWDTPDFHATVAVAFEGADDAVSKAAAAKVDAAEIAKLKKQLGVGQ